MNSTAGLLSENEILLATLRNITKVWMILSILVAGTRIILLRWSWTKGSGLGSWGDEGYCTVFGIWAGWNENGWVIAGEGVHARMIVILHMNYVDRIWRRVVNE